MMRGILLFAAMMFAGTVFSQIDVTVAGKRGNDTLIFKGLNGGEDMRRQVEKDLRNCGWFDLIPNGVSSYMISGTASGNSLRLDVTDGAGARITSVTAYGATRAEASHKAVDAVLNALYKIPGICNTKIAFAAQVAPMVKEIYVCDYDGSNFKRVTRNNGLSLDPVWSPSGKSLVYGFIGQAFSTLMEHNILSGKSRQLARFAGLNAGGRISPDGRRIALVLSKDNQVDLYVRSLEGGSPRRLTNDKTVEASPCWSPDGSKICFVSDSGYGRPRLRIISATGGTASTIPGVLGSESVSPSWAKDGKIVYSGKLGNFTVCVADPAGVSESEPRQMTGVVVSNGGDWESPSWAPDNRHVVCSNGGGLYIVDTWSGKSRQIVGGRSKCSLPDWSDILK